MFTKEKHNDLSYFCSTTSQNLRDASFRNKLIITKIVRNTFHGPKDFIDFELYRNTILPFNYLLLLLTPLLHTLIHHKVLHSKETLDTK